MILAEVLKNTKTNYTNCQVPIQIMLINKFNNYNKI